MMIQDMTGYIAALCTTVAFVPQALKAIRERDTRSLSLGMYVVFSLGVLLWLVYGIMKSDLALIAANAVTAVLSLTILAVKLRYDVFAGRDPAP